MPIHDRGYRRYQGPRLPRGRAWLIIARSGVRAMLGRRAFVALLMLSWLQFLVRSVQIYAAANLPQLQVFAPTGDTFRQFLGIQEAFVFFVAVYAGAGAIANDRRANALQIYLAKPLTRVEYVVGKIAVVFAFLLFVTWVPAFGLLLVQILFAGSFAFVAANAYLFPAITLVTFVEALTLALAVLALSSLSRSSRYVGILYAGLLFFVDALAGVLRAVTGTTALSWLSVTNSLEQLRDAIFRMPLRYDFPLPLAFLTIGLVVVLSLVVLERRVRGVEIIA